MRGTFAGARNYSKRLILVEGQDVGWDAEVSDREPQIHQFFNGNYVEACLLPRRETTEELVSYCGRKCAVEDFVTRVDGIITEGPTLPYKGYLNIIWQDKHFKASIHTVNALRSRWQGKPRKRVITCFLVNLTDTKFTELHRFHVKHISPFAETKDFFVFRRRPPVLSNNPRIHQRSDVNFEVTLMTSQSCKNQVTWG